MGLERIKYAGLLASQEEIIEELPPENLELLEEIQANEISVDGSVQIDNEQASIESPQPDDVLVKNNARRKASSRKRTDT